ncbi:MAG: hypothetical protein SWN10_21460 [Pseudomonadota bacterium]|nr:hypothetical protein [Pseudomonadota bacterium]
MKIGNTQHEMQEVARYAAWERTVWSARGSGSHHKSSSVVLNEAVARVLGEPVTPVDSTVDGRVVAAASRKFDPLLSINKGDGNRGPVFKEESGAFHNFSFNDDDAATGKVASALGSVVSYGLDLNEKGLQTSTITWKHDWVPALDFGWADITSSSTNTLLTESWNAGSPDRIKDSLDGIVATSLLGDVGLGSALRTLSGLAFFKDFDKLKLGKIDVDRMPCHRLARARGRLSC